MLWDVTPLPSRENYQTRCIKKSSAAPPGLGNYFGRFPTVETVGYYLSGLQPFQFAPIYLP
jgi:hypothetical protein